MDPISAPDLNDALNETWPFGEVGSIDRASRIGEDFGFGGAVHRLSVTTMSGPATLIAKTETHEQVERVTEAYGLMEHVLAGRVPELYGHMDTVTLFEDVSPAAQGDGLNVRPNQVTTMADLLGELHASTRVGAGFGWLPEPWSHRQWEERVTLARNRYPVLLDEKTLDRLARLHSDVPAAVETLRSGPTALIHMDSGYDNTMWRADGTIVLLDWSNSRVGPCGYDVAPHVVERDPAHVLEVYSESLQRHGLRIESSHLVNQVAAGAMILARGLVGFAGLPDEPAQPRLRRFRDLALHQVRGLLYWIDGL